MEIYVRSNPQCTVIKQSSFNNLSNDIVMQFLTEIKKEVQVYVNFNGKKQTYDPCKIINNEFVFPELFLYKFIKICELLNIEYKVIYSDDYIELSKMQDVEYGDLRLVPKDYQNTIIDYALGELLSVTGCIIKLKAGAGKTLIMCEIMRQLRVKTVIFVTNSALQEQMYNDIHNNLTLGGCDHTHGCKQVALLMSKTKYNIQQRETFKYENYKVLIAIINSALTTNNEFWNSFGLAIYDECHNYCSDKRSKIFNLCKTRYSIGTSANPDVKWNYKVLTHNIGEIYNADTLITKKQYKCTVNVIRYKGSNEYTKSIKSKSGMVSVAKMVRQFMLDENRNNIIISNIVKLLECGMNVYVFACINDMLFMLRDLFIETVGEDKCSDSNPEATYRYTVLTKDTNKNARRFMVEHSNLIFLNYSFREGLNIPRMNAIVVSSPYRNNSNQIISRAFRDNPDVTRKVVDILDVNTTLSRQFSDRHRYYKEEEFNITYS